MKRSMFAALTVLLVVFFPISSESQAIKKFPGESATISWTFPTTDESKITGFRVYASPTATGTYTFTGTAAAASLRQVALPVAYSTNSVMVFYKVKSYFTAGTTTVESDGVPVTGVEVDMNVPMPAGVQVR